MFAILLLVGLYYFYCVSRFVQLGEKAACLLGGFDVLIRCASCYQVLICCSPSVAAASQVVKRVPFLLLEVDGGRRAPDLTVSNRESLSFSWLPLPGSPCQFGVGCCVDLLLSRSCGFIISLSIERERERASERASEHVSINNASLHRPLLSALHCHMKM